MKKINNYKRIIASFFVLLLTFMTPLSSLAAETTDIEVLVGSVRSGEANKGAHYYAFSKYDRLYNKVSMEAFVPMNAPNYIELYGKRAAYISLGVKGNGAVDFGLTNVGDGWYPYCYDVNRDKFMTWPDHKLYGYINVLMELETSINRHGQTDITLTLNGKEFKYTPPNSTFTEWRGLVDNQFYRFVSLVNKEGVPDDHDDGTLLSGVDIYECKIYQYEQTSNSYPVGNPVEKGWALRDSSIDKAWKVYPDHISFEIKKCGEEAIEIAHWGPL